MDAPATKRSESARTAALVLESRLFTNTQWYAHKDDSDSAFEVPSA